MRVSILWLHSIYLLSTADCLHSNSRYSTILGLVTLTNCPPDEQFRCVDAWKNANNLSQDVKLHNRTCFIDVQNSPEYLHEIVLSYSEDTESNFTEQCLNKKAKMIFRKDEMSILFTYMSYELTRLASYLLVNEKVILLAVTFQPMLPSQLRERSYNLFSHESSFVSENQKDSVFRVAMDMGVTYFGIVYAKEYQEDENLITKACKERPTDSAFCVAMRLDQEEKSNKCFKEILMDYQNLTSVNNVLQILEEDPHMRILVAYGYGSSHQRLFKIDLFNDFMFPDNIDRKKYYFLVPFTRNFTNSSSHYKNVHNFERFQNVPGGLVMDKFVTNTLQFKENFVDSNSAFIYLVRYMPKEYLFLIKMVIPNYDSSVGITWEVWNDVPMVKREKLANIFLSSDKIMNDLLATWKRLHNFKENTADDYMTRNEFNPSVAIQRSNPYCNLTRPKTCQKGYELRHGLYHEAKWQNSYGWHCGACAEKQYKEDEGMSKCKTCNYPFTTNEAKTKCFDPYNRDYMKLHDPVMIVITILSAMTGLLIMFTSIVFIKLRDTPIVKAANRSMTVVQLFGHLLLATVTPILFLEEPTPWKCFLKPIVTGLCFTSTVSVNLAKTQKLHVIFNSKMVHSKKKQKAIAILEWLIVGMTILIDLAILASTFQNGRPVPETHRNFATQTREISCTNNNHIIIQIVYILVLVLANGIQAVRARNLPSHFKETTHVIYSSFTSVLLLGALSAIYFTQKSAKTRDVIMWASILTMNFLHFSLIYAYKLYVVLLKPNKNTKKAFQEKRKKNFDEKMHRVKDIPALTRIKIPTRK